MSKKILFVCSGNLDRSPTAENMLKGIEELEVKSAGTLQSAPIGLSKELIDWADLIFAMERKHKDAIIKTSPEAKNRIIVLTIPDRYAKDDPELKKALKEKLSNYFPSIS